MKFSHGDDNVDLIMWYLPGKCDDILDLHVFLKLYDENDSILFFTFLFQIAVSICVF